MKAPLALAALLVVSACGRPAPSPPALPLDWQLAAVNGAPVSVPAAVGLGRDRFSFRGPCNAYSGTLARGTGPALRMERLETGRTACPQLAAERQLLDLLSRVARQDVPSGAPALELVTDTGTRLQFRRMSPGV
ncbi:META domain-containing protein [Histidinibacterium lentulum]|uniref:META domain-containing protein n=1 Tax=Histidinibacterium lentulum TaxID=2480588 RepID=A0A3N2R5L0_9RHOB|nr:META domain-containing protein [Histidinibacterium lentulum]ROU02697.1 META domain-containing protein [Histidinibacterium lentulum]